MRSLLRRSDAGRVRLGLLEIRHLRLGEEIDMHHRKEEQ